MTKELNAAWQTVNKENVEDVFIEFKKKLLGVVRQVVGTKVVKVRKRKGSAWWTDEVKEAVRKKKGSLYEDS